MLSYYTIKKIHDEPEAVNEIIEYYESVYGESLTTEKLSALIDNAWINGEVIYKTEAQDEHELLDLLNERYETNYQDMDEVIANHNIDWINGDEVMAIIWD